MDTHRIPLDPREQTFLIPSGRQPLQLFLRRLPPLRETGNPPVLYVHGATFPSALSVAHRIDGRSWRDALSSAGFDAWAFDFLGFGGSDRYPEMSEPPDAQAPLGIAEQAVRDLEAAVHFVLDQCQQRRISLITHSWGSMPAGLFAAMHPELVERLVMFAPLTCRQGPRYVPRPMLPAWKLVTSDDQWTRFVEDVPADQPPVMPRTHFEDWARRYLDSDPCAAKRNPPAVKVPTGPLVEILRAWHGELAWEPAEVEAPVAIIRGVWDGLVTDADAQWLFDRLHRSTERRDVKIDRATHLMHLETARFALWRESIAFLRGNDFAG
jgi:pimeloyl-ACP methyl ester carboxylesterase